MRGSLSSLGSPKRCEVREAATASLISRKKILDEDCDNFSLGFAPG